LRAIGQANGTTIEIDLLRQRIGGQAPEPSLAKIIGDTDPFDRTVTIDADRSVVDVTSFRYLISTTTPGSVAIGALQLTYIPV
jgi:hypothetical protein